ncbi:hypothetical protein J2Z22_003613 [Paenibacillus forsythiae]|uniref:Copper amine oxidase n=1 Tax=Paenibacillus forsythiae TaxID=365616 RepID=A0ABU3HB15_9BACL|nr:hypothetical protein [Paenibacillus forsythiae]
MNGSCSSDQSGMDKERRNKRPASSKWIAASLAGVLWIMPVIGGELPLLQRGHASIAMAASSFTATKVSEEIITSGATKLKYKYTVTRSGSKASGLADVIRVDLNNPYVSIDVMTGKNGKLTTRQSTGGMAKETGAVAAVNGDYFNTSGEGAPIGGEVSGGTLVSTPSQLNGLYAFALTTDNKPVIDEFTFTGTVTAADGTQFPLSGVNKGAYSPEGGASAYSHFNAAYVYTDAWAAQDRPKNSSTSPTEVLVENGVITQISDKNTALKVTVPSGAYILRTHGTAAAFVADHLAVGQPLTVAYSLHSKTSGETMDPASLKMMIGGHTILVDKGKAAAFSRSVSSIGGYRARTALGYSADGRYVYVIAAEKNDNSSGMSLSELQSFMTSIGVYKGLNLDGGGSTTMVDRPLAETQTTLTFDTEYGTEQRSIVNGLGVYTNAPQGELKGIKISGSSVLLIGQTASYTLKGYDTYYNPIDVASANPSWKSSSGSVNVGGSQATAVKPGTATLTAASGSVSASIAVTVLGGDDLSSLKAGTASAPLKEGSVIAVPVTAVTKGGASISVPSSALKWEFVGFQGGVQDGKLSVNSVNPGVTTGYAIARYDGFSTAIVLTEAAAVPWEDFENVAYPIAFTTNVSGVQGTAAITDGSDNHAGKVLSLGYDMTAGTGKMYAYAQFNGTAGKSVPAAATSMTLDVMGDKSLNWLRAEFTDNSGATIYVDLAKAIDWTGWKTLNIDLTGSNMKFPATLKRLYVVNVEEGQDERAKTGAVAFDNIAFTMPSLSSEAGLKTGTAVMVIGQRTLTVNGTKKAIDSAPLVQNGTTYVPIRYVLDAFGGSAAWYPATRKIMVLRGSKALELTVNKKEFIINGKRQSSEVAPISLQGRTLVPLRLVSDQLGLTVKWEQKTKTVTIES